MKIKMLIICLMWTMLAGCTSEIREISFLNKGLDFCEVYNPLLPSRKDTTTTVQHLLKYSNMWNSHCQK